MTEAILGGVLIGAAAVWMMLSLGRIAGISGIVASALRAPRRSVWAVLFVLGLGIGGYLGQAVTGLTPVRAFDVVTWPLLAGGLLVGIGTRLGSGCTSGHGVCGMARLSVRSIVATIVFMAVGVTTATMVHS